jgi:hypothetical protein
MSLFSAYRFNGALRVRASATLIALTTILTLSLAAQAEDDAAQILKAMSDYVSSQGVYDLRPVSPIFGIVLRDKRHHCAAHLCNE